MTAVYYEPSTLSLARWGATLPCRDEGDGPASVTSFVRYFRVLPTNSFATIPAPRTERTLRISTSFESLPGASGRISVPSHRCSIRVGQHRYVTNCVGSGMQPALSEMPMCSVVGSGIERSSSPTLMPEPQPSLSTDSSTSAQQAVLRSWPHCAAIVTTDCLMPLSSPRTNRALRATASLGALLVMSSLSW